MTSPGATAIEEPWPRSEPASLSPGVEQQELRDAIRGLLAKHSDIDAVRKASASDHGFSRELWQQLADNMSVAALAVPESHGGLGYGTDELSIIGEECGRALVCEPVLSSAIVGTQALLLGAADESIAALLAQAMDGSLLVAVSSLEPEHDQLDAVETDSGWTVSGTVTHVVGGDAADVLVVSAETTGGRRNFAVHPSPRSRVTRSAIDPTRRLADVSFEGSAALAMTEPGADAAFRARIDDLRTLAVACENTGIVDRLLELTLEYVSTREQFGRPIGSFQAIKHRLADLLITLERARSASRYAAAVFAEDPDEAQLAVAVAGAVCTDAALEAAAEAIQLHGGVGFTWEHPAHSYFRRALGNEALQGDSRRHRARIADLIGI